jgi:hypothetical protein
MTKLHWACVGLVGVSGALLACSGSSGGGSGTDSGTGGPDAKQDTGTGSADGGKDGTSPSDAAKDGTSSTEGGSGSCSAPSSTGKTHSGVILLSQVTFPAPGDFGIIGAFYSGIDHSDACNGMMVGACCYQTPPAPPPYASAGTLTVSDGTTTLDTLMAPATAGPYVGSSFETSTIVWAPGDTLKVVGSGGTVDAFTISVVAPALLTGVTPALTAALTVPTTADLVVTWTPSSQACSKVIFGLSQMGTGLPEIGCTADDSDGTLTVPSSLLGMFTATSGTANIQRIETTSVLNANSIVGVVASNVTEQEKVTYTK